MLQIDDTAFVIVDVQGKLAKIMHESEALLTQLEKLIQGVKVLGIPVLWLEQYPKGLGPTDERVSQHLKEEEPISKMVFSAYGSEEFLDQLRGLDRNQLLVAGIESHICVYQTVRQLLEADYEVEVVADCISSRTAENSQIGLERMLSYGAELTSVEMALFELLQTAEHPKFKEISKIIK